MDAVSVLTPEVGAVAACAAFDLPRASFYRTRRDRPPVALRRRTGPPRTLASDERQAVLDLLRSERFVDLAPAEVYASLLDEGAYPCSIRTMYRILASENEVRERRNQAPSSRLQKTRAFGTKTQRGVVLGHNETDGASEMDLLLSTCRAGDYAERGRFRPSVP